MVLLVRAILQNKKAAIDDLENTLDSLKVDLESAFKRQGIIEEQIRELRKGKFRSKTPTPPAYNHT